MKKILPASMAANNGLKTFFIHHLNMVYCAKSHLVERLPELAELADYSDLQLAIGETLEDVQRQMIRMAEIFTLLDTVYFIDNCEDMINHVERSFRAIQSQSIDHTLRDMAILYYLQNMESLEMSSFQVLLLVAAKLKNKQVTQLIKENYDESKEDKALLLLVTAKYLLN